MPCHMYAVLYDLNTKRKYEKQEKKRRKTTYLKSSTTHQARAQNNQFLLVQEDIHAFVFCLNVFLSLSLKVYVGEFN